ncbi:MULTISPECIES: hypothetical protein [unclassified Bradyrhizobium]|uniref:hypothetical protein n=1 Tax=unclassified Bradyrhizobium TaxID=2631580 RepID=UPI00291665BF|nr:MULTISPECIES: hypothetical protein [unclassified Bradyrhizobium]
MAITNIPQGGHEQVLLGANWDVVEKWNGVISQVDEQLLQHYFDRRAELIGIFAFAHVAKAAYSLASQANAASTFDPEEFGRRCADIAREQLGRCEQRQFLPEGE